MLEFGSYDINCQTNLNYKLKTVSDDRYSLYHSLRNDEFQNSQSNKVSCISKTINIERTNQNLRLFDRHNKIRANKCLINSKMNGSKRNSNALHSDIYCGDNEYICPPFKKQIHIRKSQGKFNLKRWESELRETGKFGQNKSTVSNKMSGVNHYEIDDINEFVPESSSQFKINSFSNYCNVLDNENIWLKSKGIRINGDDHGACGQLQEYNIPNVSKQRDVSVSLRTNFGINDGLFKKFEVFEYGHQKVDVDKLEIVVPHSPSEKCDSSEISLDNRDAGQCKNILTNCISDHKIVNVDKQSPVNPHCQSDFLKTDMGDSKEIHSQIKLLADIVTISPSSSIEKKSNHTLSHKSKKQTKSKSVVVTRDKWKLIPIDIPRRILISKHNIEIHRCHKSDPRISHL